MKNYIVILVAAVIAYVVYRKFGSSIRDAVTNITK